MKYVYAVILGVVVPSIVMWGIYLLISFVEWHAAGEVNWLAVRLVIIISVSVAIFACSLDYDL